LTPLNGAKSSPRSIPLKVFATRDESRGVYLQFVVIRVDTPNKVS
jgi:hypothetical protein